MRTLIAGNWTMNGLQAQIAEIAEIAAMARAFADGPSDVEELVCVPATLIAHAAQAADGLLEMLRDEGATSVILGHSERRQGHHETDATVAAKAKAACQQSLATIVGIGETQAQRSDGDALKVCGDQLAASLPDIPARASTTIAYEPLWEIGSGTMPTREQIVEVFGHVRAALDERFGSAAQAIRILYGGSVKAENALEILNMLDVEGVLIGGASLLAVDFNAIVSVARGRTPNRST